MIETETANTFSSVNERKDLKIIFLLGAGASKPSGIPTIKSMTDEFLEHPLLDTQKKHYLENEESYRRKFYMLSLIAGKTFEKSDIEYMMSVLISLKDANDTGQLIEQKLDYYVDQLLRVIHNGRLAKKATYPKIELINDLQNKLEQFIRKKCETLQGVDYLRPLVALHEYKPMNIFTLNYDATIEIFCENQGLTYTDGVYPYWNEKDFDKKNDINLYKLHGSLYWLRTDRKIFKVPIKGLKLSQVSYLTDEPVYEMMIYPAIQKNKQLATYSWLSQKFRDELSVSELCIIIGYSFRDKDIKESISEALTLNRKLWLIIIDPNANLIKKENFHQYPEFSARIIASNTLVEESVTNRELHEQLRHLQTARRLEEEASRAQTGTKNRLDDNYWNLIIRNYLRIGHHDRIKWIVEDLLTQKFDTISGNFPNTIEGILGIQSLSYMIHYRNQNKAKFNVWKKFFIETFTAYEHSFFARHSEQMMRDENPITTNDFPSWFKPMNSSGYVDVYGLKEELEKVEEQIPKSHLHQFYKLKRTLHILEERIPTANGYQVTPPEESMQKYNKEDLGLKKWATSLAEQLSLD